MNMKFYSGNDYDVAQFAQKLYNARTQLGLGINEFAKFIGSSYTTYYQNEKGKVTKISVELVDRLCEKFNTNTDFWIKPLNTNCLSSQVKRWIDSEEAVPYLKQAYQKFQHDKYAELERKAKEIGSQL